MQRNGIDRLLLIEGDEPTRKAFRCYPIGDLRIDIAEVRLARRYRTILLFVPIK